MQNIFHKLDDKDLKKVAIAAYIYGYPLVESVNQLERYVKKGVDNPNAACGWNVISQSNKLSTPGERFCSVNNDTVYGQACIDSSAGPLVLEIPEFPDKRYFSAQFVDAWSNVYAYIGTRSTGSAAQKCYIVPPGFTGSTPIGMHRIEMPTTVGAIVLRYFIRDAADYENVAKYQAETVLTPEHPEARLRGIPALPPNTPEHQAFFERMRLLMRAFPAHLCDHEFAETKMAALGLLEDRPVSQSSPEAVQAMSAVFSEGPQILDACSRDFRAGKTEIQTARTIFNYNEYYFQIGTLKDARFRFTDRSVALCARAVVAHTLLWGNVPYEALYAALFCDADGEALDGSCHKYTITIPPLSLKGFWSLTMYNYPHFYLVDNEINRYSIGCRTPGVHEAPDQTITVYVQSTAPTDPAQLSNWLPAPKGPFRPLLRAYLPNDNMMNGDNFDLPEFQKETSIQSPQKTTATHPATRVSTQHNKPC